MAASNNSLRSYVDRILNVMGEQDALGKDKKEIYKEVADAKLDRTVVAQLVGYLRKKAKKPGKFAEQSALFDQYLAGYEGVGTVVATRRAHAAREITDTAPTPHPPEAVAADAAGDDPHTTAPGADELVAVTPDHDDDRPATGEEPDLAPALQAAPIPDTRTSIQKTVDEVKAKHNPETHFLNSQGLKRLHGCQKPEACGGNWRQRCFGCQLAYAEAHGETA
jgi:uncharacterized protein (UPF0335 family)